jgi:hypothetical protein
VRWLSASYHPASFSHDLLPWLMKMCWCLFA